MKMSRFAHKFIIVHQREMSTLFVFAQQKIHPFILQKHKLNLDIPSPFLYIITITSAMTGISLHVGFTESNRLVEDCKPLLASHPGAEKRAGTICVKKSGTAETVRFRLFYDFYCRGKRRFSVLWHNYFGGI